MALVAFACGHVIGQASPYEPYDQEDPDTPYCDGCKEWLSQSADPNVEDCRQLLQRWQASLPLEEQSPVEEPRSPSLAISFLQTPFAVATLRGGDGRPQRLIRPRKLQRSLVMRRVRRYRPPRALPHFPRSVDRGNGSHRGGGLASADEDDPFEFDDSYADGIRGGQGDNDDGCRGGRRGRGRRVRCREDDDDYDDYDTDNDDNAYAMEVIDGPSCGKLVPRKLPNYDRLFRANCFRNVFSRNSTWLWAPPEHKTRLRPRLCWEENRWIWLEQIKEFRRILGVDRTHYWVKPPNWGTRFIREPDLNESERCASEAKENTQTDITFKITAVK